MDIQNLDFEQNDDLIDFLQNRANLYQEFAGMTAEIPFALFLMKNSARSHFFNTIDLICYHKEKLQDLKRAIDRYLWKTRFDGIDYIKDLEFKNKSGVYYDLIREIRKSYFIRRVPGPYLSIKLSKEKQSFSKNFLLELIAASINNYHGKYQNTYLSCSKCGLYIVNPSKIQMSNAKRQLVYTDDPKDTRKYVSSNVYCDTCKSPKCTRCKKKLKKIEINKMIDGEKAYCDVCKGVLSIIEDV